MPLPPRPNPHVMRTEEEQTPIGTRASIVELKANTQDIGKLMGELGQAVQAIRGWAEWCTQHDKRHAAGELMIEGFKTEVRKKLVDLKDAQDAHTRAEIKRRPLTAAQVVGYGTAIAGVVAALFGGASQLASSLTATARAQSAEVATQKVEQVDGKRHEADVQAAAQRGFELGQQQMDAKWRQRLIDEAAKADARVAPKRGKR